MSPSTALSLENKIIELNYYCNEYEFKYHNIVNGWTFVSTSVWKNSLNTVVRGLGMLHCFCVLKSMNSKAETSPRISTHSEVELSNHWWRHECSNRQRWKKIAYTTCQIEKYKYLTDFSLENSLSCLKTKFQKRWGEKKINRHLLKKLKSPAILYTLKQEVSTLGWLCKIYQQHLCRGVRPPSPRVFWIWP